MIDKKDVNALLFLIFWLILTIWAALDGITLLVVTWGGAGIVLYNATVRQWGFQGISWEVIVLFISTVVVFSTAVVYLFLLLGFIARGDLELLYTSKLIPGQAGIVTYIAFQAKLLRQQHRQIQKGLRQINGDKS